MVWTWFSKKVRQVCDGGFRLRTMFLPTLVSPMSMPSLSNSPWMRGAPQSGLSRHILRISSRTSLGTGGRPNRPRRTFQVQISRKPLRCQAMTVSGLTLTKEDRQSPQASQSHAQRSRSAEVSFGRLTERRRTPSWRRSARCSSWSADRDLKAVNAADANTRIARPATERNCWRKGKLHVLMQFDIYDSHRLLGRA